jgi:hypothetical protein
MDARGVLGDFQEGTNIWLNVARRTRRAAGCHDRQERATPARLLTLNSNRPQSIHDSRGNCRCQVEGLGRQKYPLQYRRAFQLRPCPHTNLTLLRSQVIMKSISVAAVDLLTYYASTRWLRWIPEPAPDADPPGEDASSLGGVGGRGGGRESAWVTAALCGPESRA